MSNVLIYQAPEGFTETAVDFAAVRRYPPARYLNDEQILLMMGAELAPPGTPFWVADLDALAATYAEYGSARDVWQLDTAAMGEPLGYGVEAPDAPQYDPESNTEDLEEMEASFKKEGV